MPSWQNSWKGLEMFKEVCFLTCPQIDKKWSWRNRGGIFPIKCKLCLSNWDFPICIGGESHFDLSIYGAENFEKSLSVLGWKVRSNWMNRAINGNLLLFSPLIWHLGVCICFFCSICLYIFCISYIFWFLSVLCLFFCSIWMNKAINGSLFHFSVTVDLLDCV